MKAVAVIPARGGSKGLPRKNLQLLRGEPLVVHAIAQAQAARHVKRVIVTTDDEEIASVARAAGAEVPFLRPAALATDDAVDLDVFRHLLAYLRAHEAELPDLLVQVRATSPVRRPETIDLAIEKLLAHPEADSLRSISPIRDTPYKAWYAGGDTLLSPVVILPNARDWYDMPRQALPDIHIQDGLVDVIRPVTILEKNSMAGDVVLGLMHPETAVDIDDLGSLERAERILARSVKRPEEKAPLIGIVQGRLTDSADGLLQCFPHGRWREEFTAAAQLGLRSIELLVERQVNPDNPLWSPHGRAELRRAMAETGVEAPTACIDYVIDYDVRDEETQHYLAETATALADAGITLAVLPLFEASGAADAADLAGYLHPLRRVADAYRREGLRVCLETDWPAHRLYEFLGGLNRDNVAVCYDIGNTTALGYDTVAEVRLLGPSIAHVHVKDKSSTGASVPLGTGAADLSGTLQELSRQGYPGMFILETPRGDDPWAAALQHSAFVSSALNLAGEFLTT